MNASKLYLVVFLFIYFFASFLILIGYQNIGIIILLVLGFPHLIIFHIAEKDFIGIRLKVKDIINSVLKKEGGGNDY